MNKQQFLNALAEALKKLPREERYRTLSYYDELIDDRIEDGQNEYAVVESLGSPEAIAGDIFGSEEAEKTKKEYGKGAKIWIIVLLILGFPCGAVCFLWQYYWFWWPISFCIFPSSFWELWRWAFWEPLCWEL